MEHLWERELLDLFEPVDRPALQMVCSASSINPLSTTVLLEPPIYTVGGFKYSQLIVHLLNGTLHCFNFRSSCQVIIGGTTSGTRMHWM